MWYSNKSNLPNSQLSAFGAKMSTTPQMSTTPDICQHFQINIPVPYSVSTQEEWENLEYNIKSTTSGDLIYKYGEIYDTKSPFDEGTYTDNGIQYICITPDSNNPLLAAMFQLADLYGFWSINPKIQISVLYNNSQYAPVIRFAASPRAWSSSFPNMDGMLGNEKYYGNLSLDNNTAILNFVGDVGKVWSKLSNRYNLQGTDNPNDKEKRMTWDIINDGPMFVFSPLFPPISQSQILQGKPCCIIKIDVDLCFMERINTLATTRYIDWRKNGFPVDSSGSDNETNIGIISASLSGSGTVNSGNYQVSLGNYTSRANSLSSEKGGVVVVKPKSAAYQNTRVRMEYLDRLIKRSGLSGLLRKNAYTASTGYNIFGTEESNIVYGYTSNRLVNNLKRTLGSVGSGQSEIVDDTKLYGYNALGYDTLKSSESMGCGIVPPCCSLLSAVTFESTAGKSDVQNTVEGYESAFIPNNTFSVVSDSNAILASDNDLFVTYQPFLPKDNSFSSSSEVNAPEWILTHQMVFGGKGVEFRNDNYTIGTGMDTGSGVEGDVIEGEISSEITDSLAAKNSKVIVLPRELQVSNDPQLKLQYMRMLRKQATNGGFANFIGAVGNVATSIANALRSDTLSASNNLTILSGQGGNFNSTESIKNSSSKKAVSAASAFMRCSNMPQHSQFLQNRAANANETFQAQCITIQTTEGLCEIVQQEPTPLVSGLFSNYPNATKLAVLPPTVGTGQQLKIDMSCTFCMEGTLFYSNPVGVTRLAAETSGSFCYTELTDTYNTTLTQQALSLDTTINVYPVITASFVPPKDVNFFKQCVFLTNPERSFTQVVGNTKNITSTRQAKLRIASKDSPNTYIDVPIFSSPVLYSNTIGIHQNVFIPSKLPDESGILRSVNVGDNIYIACIFLIQSNFKSSYSAVETVSDITNAKEYFTWKKWDNGSAVKFVPTFGDKTHGGYLVGYAAGNDNILMSDGSVKAATNKHCMDIIDFDFSFQSNTPKQEIIKI